MMRPQRLSAIEASFVALERDRFPMHVAGVVVLEGPRPITMPELKNLAAARLSRLPKLHQRLLVPFGGRRASWVPVTRTDYGAHLFHHRLPPPGRPARFRELCALIHEKPLDRSGPLWETHLIDGLSGHRQAVLIKTHHAITDGLAGIEIAEVMFDPAPGVARPRLPGTRFVEKAQPSPLAALRGLLGLGFTAAGGPVAAEGPFNGPVGHHRAFGAAALRMDDIQRVKRMTGGSIDDVVMAIVAAGLSHHLRDMGYPTIPAALRAMVPVSTRPPARGVRLGNHVSAVFVDLPMGIEDLPTLVRQIAASKATLRTAHATAGSAMLIEAAAMLPGPLHTALLRFASGLPFAHLVLSDVPGPAEDLYLLGRRVVACYPMMPLAGDLGLSIATVSLGGVMGVGVTADPDLVPDAQRVANAIRHVLAVFATAAPQRTAA